MRPTQSLRSEDPPCGYLNKATWGNLGVATPERGIITYALSSDRQNILAGAGVPALRNTWRRFAGQVLFWAPPLVAAWYAMEWANKRNEYLNSKKGRASAHEE
ncbi:hypothetical protein PG989_010281 [Apiospora arundinis]